MEITFKNDKRKEDFENDKFIQVLLEVAKIGTYINNDDGHIPEIYIYNGLRIKYLPHWSFYEIEGRTISIKPINKEELDSDVMRFKRQWK